MIPDFQNTTTKHCVSGSLSQVYHFNGHALSEEMLLGLGRGVGFIYWHMKGTLPFLGGRAMPKPSLEELAGGCTGVVVKAHTSTSMKRSRSELLELLTAGQPVMLQVDMGFLPYLDLGGTEFHFGAHVVVACGYDADADSVWIADRDGVHPVPMADLEKARASTFKPFPPKSKWWTFDFSDKREPTNEELELVIREQATLMLEPPIRNIGVRGIRKAADMVPGWTRTVDSEQLRSALFNGFIFINAKGGTGGGMFRYMFSDFLREAANLTKASHLETTADEFRSIGDDWERIADWFHTQFEAESPERGLNRVSPMLRAVADKEEEAWATLLD